MNKYIDVDKLSKMIEARAETLVEGTEAFYYIANWLKKLPPADVVEVVHCKDCRLSTEDIMIDGWYHCRNNGMMHKPDAFCCYGERKDEE